MKGIILLLATLFVVSANSSEFDGYGKGLIKHVEKVRAFMEKKSPCYLSYMQLSEQNINSPDDWSIYPNSVFCVQDMVYRQGTMGEESGCYMMLYFPKKNQYKNIYQRRAMNEVPKSNKACAKGGFEELKKKKFIILRGWTESSNVFDYTLGGAMNRYSCYQRMHLMNYKDSSVKKYFNEKYSAIDKEVSDKCKKKKEQKEARQKNQAEEEEKIEKKIKKKQIKAKKLEKKKEAEKKKKFESLFD